MPWDCATYPPSTDATALATPLSYTLQNSTVTIGGVAANVVFSGLTPGFSGLYQLNALVPSGTPNGDDVALVFSAGGALSNTLLLSPRVSRHLAAFTMRIEIRKLTIPRNGAISVGLRAGASNSVKWSYNESGERSYLREALVCLLTSSRAKAARVASRTAVKTVTATIIFFAARTL